MLGPSSKVRATTFFVRGPLVRNGLPPRLQPIGTRRVAAVVANDANGSTSLSGPLEGPQPPGGAQPGGASALAGAAQASRRRNSRANGNGRGITARRKVPAGSDGLGRALGQAGVAHDEAVAVDLELRLEAVVHPSVDVADGPRPHVLVALLGAAHLELGDRDPRPDEVGSAG